MIWGRREFLAQFKPQGLGWDLSAVLCTELSTKKSVTQQWWLVIQCALGCERRVYSSSALPSACVLSRRASGWPGGRKLLLGRSSSRTRLMVLGWLLSQVIFLVRKSWAKHFADRLCGFLLNHSFSCHCEWIQELRRSNSEVSLFN